MQLQSEVRNDNLRELDDLKLAFNALSEELRSLKSKLLFLEEAISSVQSNLKLTQRRLEMEIASTRTYAKVVSRIESRVTRGRETLDH